MEDLQYDFCVDASSSVEVIVDVVKECGIALIPGYVGGQSLTEIQSEFARAYHPQYADDFWHDRIGCHNLRADRGLLNNELFPTIAQLYGSAFMSDVAEKFYGGTDFLLNHEIFICHHYPTDEPIDQLPYLLHFDKTQTLKFFLYVDQTREENGALEVVPGTHLQNRRIRQEAVHNRLSLAEINNVVEASPSETIPVAAAAGAMIVFDTDLTHRAGHVHPGCDRKVIRGHTRHKSDTVSSQPPVRPRFLQRIGERLGLASS